MWPPIAALTSSSLVWAGASTSRGLTKRNNKKQIISQRLLKRPKRISTSRGRMEDICNGEDLVDYGKWERFGTGHRRGGAGRRRQRGSRSAPDGGTGTSGGAVWRPGEARYAGSAR